MTDLTAEMLAALLTDDAKGKRLAELLDQEKKNQAVLDEAKATHIAASRLREAGAVHFQAGEQALADAAKAQEQVKADAAANGEMLTALNAEKAAFEAVRQKVTADHNEREAKIAAKETELASRERLVGEREERVRRNAADLKAASDAHTARVKRLQEAWEGMKPETEAA